MNVDTIYTPEVDHRPKMRNREKIIFFFFAIFLLGIARAIVQVWGYQTTGLGSAIITITNPLTWPFHAFVAPLQIGSTLLDPSTAFLLITLAIIGPLVARISDGLRIRRLHKEDERSAPADW
jgi:hypothetical protein